MNDFLISMSVSVLIQLIRTPSIRGKWKAALLKIFKEIAIAFKDDPSFQATAAVHVTPFEQQ